MLTWYTSPVRSSGAPQTFSGMTIMKMSEVLKGVVLDGRDMSGEGLQVWVVIPQQYSIPLLYT